MKIAIVIKKEESNKEQIGREGLTLVSLCFVQYYLILRIRKQASKDELVKQNKEAGLFPEDSSYRL